MACFSWPWIRRGSCARHVPGAGGSADLVRQDRAPHARNRPSPHPRRAVSRRSARRERAGIALDATSCAALAAVLASLGLPGDLPYL